MFVIWNLFQLRGSQTRPIHPYHKSYQRNAELRGRQTKAVYDQLKESKTSSRSVSIEEYIIFECHHIFTLLHHFAPAARHSIEVGFVSEAHFDCAAMRKGGTVVGGQTFHQKLIWWGNQERASRAIARTHPLSKEDASRKGGSLQDNEGSFVWLKVRKISEFTRRTRSILESLNVNLKWARRPPSEVFEVPETQFFSGC